VQPLPSHVRRGDVNRIPNLMLYTYYAARYIYISRVGMGAARTNHLKSFIHDAADHRVHPRVGTAFGGVPWTLPFVMDNKIYNRRAETSWRVWVWRFRRVVHVVRWRPLNVNVFMSIRLYCVHSIYIVVVHTPRSHIYGSYVLITCRYVSKDDRVLFFFFFSKIS
jgi:hypothetical protein